MPRKTPSPTGNARPTRPAKSTAALNNKQPKPAQVQATRNLVVCRADGQFKSKVNPEDISEILQRKDQFVWLDMQDPQDEDIALLRDEFKFHRLAIEDAVRHHERPKVDSYEGYYFLIFYVIIYNEKSNLLHTEAMHLFIGANYIVSVHEGEIPAIGETIKRWQNAEGEVGNDSGTLLYSLLDAI